jgi:hypothetical protein
MAASRLDSKSDNEDKKEEVRPPTSKPSRARFFVPTLQELTARTIINQLGDVQAVEKFILQLSSKDLKHNLSGPIVVFEHCLQLLKSKLNELLNHVVHGKLKEADAILKANPDIYHSY